MIDDRLRTEILCGIADALLADPDGSHGAVYLYPHHDVDGDGLATALAMLLALTKAGVAARLPLDEEIPAKLNFLPALDRVEPFDPRDTDRWSQGQRLALILDCNGPDRLGSRAALCAAAPRRLVIDHHVSSGQAGPDTLIDPDAAATAELVYRLITLLARRTGKRLQDESIDSLLMTAIVSDTGGFIFANTTAMTFRTAARLMRSPLDLRQITYHLFDRSSRAKLRLKGAFLSSARFAPDGRVAAGWVSRSELDGFGAVESDVDGLVNSLRNVIGVEVAFVLREIAPGKIKVNIRSSDVFDAAHFAAEWGGGGHQRAAGMEVAGYQPKDLAEILMRQASDRLP